MHAFESRQGLWHLKVEGSLDVHSLGFECLGNAAFSDLKPQVWIPLAKKQTLKLSSDPNLRFYLEKIDSVGAVCLCVCVLTSCHGFVQTLN